MNKNDDIDAIIEYLSSVEPKEELILPMSDINLIIEALEYYKEPILG